MNWKLIAPSVCHVKFCFIRFAPILVVNSKKDPHFIVILQLPHGRFLGMVLLGGKLPIQFGHPLLEGGNQLLALCQLDGLRMMPPPNNIKWGLHLFAPDKFPQPLDLGGLGLDGFNISYEHYRAVSDTKGGLSSFP